MFDYTGGNAMELLAPAGSYDSLKAAVNAGADAVYIGGGRFGARAYADNPGEELLLRGIDYCHVRKRKVYLTVNTLLKERELEEELYEYMLPCYREGLDGVIVQDFGVLCFLKRNFPLLPVHASTQMTVTGVDGAKFLGEQGISRVVTARELSIDEIREIISETELEVETFVHGAMCYSYSGQCLFSSMIGGRSGNRGRCAQPCRLQYGLYDEEGKRLANAQHLMSLKDMCAVDLLPELVDAGIASFKIEGRMKRPEYTAGVVSVYRKYLDEYLQGNKVCVSSEDKRVLLDLYSRGGFTQGYYHRKNGPSMMTMRRPNHQGSDAAEILKRGKYIQAKALCRISKGDILEAVPDAPGKKGLELTMKETAEKGELFRLPSSFSGLPDGQKLFRTHSEVLLKSINEAFILTECKEKINGVLIISPGKPVILKVIFGAFEVTEQGGAAERALRQPVMRETILRQLKKTGDSPFVFDRIEIRMEDEVFLPLQVLNQLRRDALAHLEEKILSAGRREVPRPDFQAGCGIGEIQPENPKVPPVFASVQAADGGALCCTELPLLQRAVCTDHGKADSGGNFRLTVSVQEREQLEEVLKKTSFGALPVDTVYLDAQFFLPRKDGKTDEERSETLIRCVQEAGCRCFLQMPPIFRSSLRRICQKPGMRRILARADGFLVRTVDVFAFLQYEGYGQPIVAEEGLYAYNREAAAFLEWNGADRLTLPVELNRSELGTLDRRGAEIIVYGRIPLMFTAQCLKKNTSGCTGIPAVLYLEDRKRMVFPVRTRCQECCNVIYNSVPLNLLSCAEEIRSLGPSYLRLSFTTETAEEVRNILSEYSEFLSGDRKARGAMPGTRGHFRRGVE